MRNKIIIRLLCIIFLTSSLCLSQTIEEIKSSVTFIYLPNAKGDLEPNGTGFFIGIEDTVKKTIAIYVVTAKHVLWDTSKKSFVPNAYLRLDQKNGEVNFVRMPMHLSGNAKNVFVHADSTVDLVVIQGVPNPEKYTFHYISHQLIRTSQEIRKIGLTEGTDVMYPALFMPHLGEHKNYPIIRFGKLAMVSDEKIYWDGQFERLYLIESISIGGHSGAPVFLWFEPLGKPGDLRSYEAKRIRLLGVMQGIFEQERPIGFRQTKNIPTYGFHMGISAIVPVDFLQEILFGKEAINARFELYKKIITK